MCASSARTSACNLFSLYFIIHVLCVIASASGDQLRRAEANQLEEGGGGGGVGGGKVSRLKTQMS